MIRIIHITLWILLATAIHANASDDLSSKAIGYIRSHPEIVQADLGDLKELRIGGKASGLAGHQYIYVQQQKDGVDIHQASVTVCFGPGQQVLSVHGTFVAHLNEKLKDKGYYLSPGDILSRYQSTYQPGIAINQKVSSKAEYDRTADPRKVWWNISQDEYILVYEIIIHIPKDVRKIIYDASTGEILEDKSLYQACRFEIPASASLPGPSENSSASSEFGDPVNSYRVFPLGSENPSRGDRVLLSNPSDPVASPYGWHDTDGTPGAEFLTTKGNNAEVAEDEDGDNLPGQMADGGASLEFDFPMATDATPMANLNASLTNTFYWMNINHDVFYHYGFQERDGNFQRNNYGQAGLANDPVQVDALDGGNLNNARFYAPADGAPGRLELFLWGANRANLILNRRGQSQKQVTSIESNFGAQNKLQRLGGITGPLSLVIDGDAGTHWGCPDVGLTTGSQISGKIAVVQKGMCPNLDKILNLQEQGATGVIVVNDIPGDPILMNGSGTTVVIPAVMISKEDGKSLINDLKNGIEYTARLSNGPQDQFRDPGFDNAILTHEFGHGISSRLTGGPANTDCLDNELQLSEGWSDYFALMLTTDWKSARAEDPRTIGAWLLAQDSTGLRKYPYSYSKGVNLLLYDDLYLMEIPHGVGALWCSMLWDMTWSIIWQEGISQDIYLGTGGNNIALRLVMEGLKIQPCGATFTEARDAILDADVYLYGSRHHQAIWWAFARRGLGVGAIALRDYSSFYEASHETPSNSETKIEFLKAVDSLGVVVVTWNTIQEFDNKIFVLEKREPLTKYREIARFPGLTLDVKGRSFRFLDDQVAKGGFYSYQLGLYDIQDQWKILETTSVQLSDYDQLALFPNPVISGRFIARLGPAVHQVKQIRVLSGTGTEVFVQDYSSGQDRQIEIALPPLPAGIYLVQLITDTKSLVRKLQILN